MDSDTLASLGILIMILSVISFLVGFFMAIFSQKNRIKGISLLIGSIIGFIIGFGTCLANINLGGMH